MNSKSEYSRCKLPHQTIDRDTWNSQKQEKSSINKVEDVALEKLSKELEDKLANPRMKTFLQDGKRRKEQPRTKTAGKKKKLKLDPLVGWGEGEEREEELEIHDWISRTDRVLDYTLGGVESGRIGNLSKWRQQKLSFTDQSILPSVNGTQIF